VAEISISVLGSGNEYESHTKCISEEEKYSGKNYKPKPNANKGEIKQELWTQVFSSLWLEEYIFYVYISCFFTFPRFWLKL